MTHAPNDILSNFIDTPGGGLVVEGLQIGRVRFGKITISDREGAFNAQDLINAVLSKTARIRSGKHGTRYSEPLPPGSPARLLSIEIEDFSRHQSRRYLKSGTINDYARTLKLLLLTIGDIPVSRIDHTHVDRLWDLLRWAPPGFLQYPKLRALTADEVIALGQANGTQGVSHATLHKHNLCLSAFFRRLVATRAIPGNPMIAMGKIKKDLISDPNVARRQTDSWKKMNCSRSLILSTSLLGQRNGPTAGGASSWRSIPARALTNSHSSNYTISSSIEASGVLPSSSQLTKTSQTMSTSKLDRR